MIGLLMTVAAVSSAFNLECTGTAYHANSLFAPQTNVHQFDIVYRVDLTKKRFCRNACTITTELPKITDTMIVFESEQKDSIDDVLVYADRETGKYFDRRRWFDGKDMQIDLGEGKCERKPFTGFPARLF